jgi:hypothetical protein
LGNSGKSVTLETSSLTKFLRCVFRDKALAIFRNLGPAKPRSREYAIFGDLESAKPRRHEHAKTWKLELAKLRTSGDGKFGNCRKPGSEVANGEIHEPVGSKVKVVVPKSPGLECELVAGL